MHKILDMLEEQIEFYVRNKTTIPFDVLESWIELIKHDKTVQNTVKHMVEFEHQRYKPNLNSWQKTKYRDANNHLCQICGKHSSKELLCVYKVSDENQILVLCRSCFSTVRNQKHGIVIKEELRSNGINLSEVLR